MYYIMLYIYTYIYICIYIIENLYNDSMTQSLEWHDVDEHEHIRKVEGLSGKYLARSVVLHTSVGRRIEFGNCKHAGYIYIYIYIYKYNVFSFSLITMETPTILTTLIPRPMKFILAKHTYTCIRVYIYIYMYIYIYICIHMCIYIYIYI